MLWSKCKRADVVVYEVWNKCCGLNEKEQMLWCMRYGANVVVYEDIEKILWSVRYRANTEVYKGKSKGCRLQGTEQTL